MTMLYLYLVEHQETGPHLRQCNGTTDRHEGAMEVAVAVRSSSGGKVIQHRQVMAGAASDKAAEEQRDTRGDTRKDNGLKVQLRIGVAIDPIQVVVVLHVVLVLVCLTRITTTTTKHRPKKLFPLLCPNGNPRD